MPLLTELEFVLVCKLQRCRTYAALTDGKFPLGRGDRRSYVAKPMIKKFCFFVLVALFARSAFCQSMYERFPNKPEQFSVLLFGYSGNLKIEQFGSASLYTTPISTNGQGIVCLVTAKHNLSNLHTGKMFDGLLVKISMPHGSKPKYLKIPLKHNSPKSYWESPSGLDLVAIPIPANLVQGDANATFSESQIVTPQNTLENDISAGMLVEMFCGSSTFVMGKRGEIGFSGVAYDTGKDVSTDIGAG
jgi:hypothetical protein